MFGLTSRTMVMLALLGACSPAAAQSSPDAERETKRAAKIRERMAALTPADFQRTASIRDDDLDPEAVITTEPGFYYRGGFTDRYRTDSFIRAIVSKRTGGTVFQVYATIDYSGDWRRYRSASFATSDGPRSVEVIPINDKVDCTYGLCSRLESVGFVIDEAVLRQLAGTYNVASPPLWRFRFRAQSGDAWTEEMSTAEIAGAIAAVDKYRASKPRRVF